MSDYTLTAKLGLQDNLSPGLHNVNNALGSVDRATNQFTNSANSASQSTGGFGGALQVLQGVIAVVSIASLAKSLFDWTTEAAKAQDQTVIFGKSFKDVDGTIDKLRTSTKGLISDTQLVQLTNKAVAQGMTTDVDKLSVVYQESQIRAKLLGRSTEEVFTSISNATAKGTALPLEMLGIKLPDAFKKTLTHMDLTEKKQAILNFVMNQGKEDMEKYGNSQLSTSEKVQQFNTKIDNFKNSIGKALVPVLDKVLDVIGLVGGKIKDFLTPVFQQIGVVLQPVIEVIKKVAEFLKEKFETAINSVKESLPKILPHIQKMNESFKKIADIIGKVVLPVLKFLWENVLKPFISWLSENAGPILEKVFNILADVISGVADGVEKAYNFLKPVLEKIFEIFSTIFNAVRSVVETVFNIISSIIHVAVGIWNSVISPALNFIFNIFKTVFEQIRSVVEWVFNAIKVVVEIGMAIWNKFVFPVLENVFHFFQNIFNGIRNSIETAFNAIRGPIESVVGWFRDHVGPVFNQVIEGIKNAFGSVRGFVENVMNGIVGTIKNIMNGVIRLVNSFIGSINQSIGSINNVADSLHVGNKVGYIGYIPYLAKGTDNFSGGLAIVGEKGPELVNLPKGSQVKPADTTKQLLSKSPQNITINIMGANKSPIDIAKEVQRTLAKMNQVTQNGMNSSLNF